MPSAAARVVDFVDGVLDHLDRQLACLRSPAARQRFLLDQHHEWTAATARRACRVRYVDELDDHFRIIAGITARLNSFKPEKPSTGPDAAACAAAGSGDGRDPLPLPFPGSIL